MKDSIKELTDKWKAENEKLKSDYAKLESAEDVIGKGKLDNEKFLILRERGRLQTCIMELQNLLLMDV